MEIQVFGLIKEIEEFGSFGEYCGWFTVYRYHG